MHKKRYSFINKNEEIIKNLLTEFYSEKVSFQNWVMHCYDAGLHFDHESIFYSGYINEVLAMKYSGRFGQGIKILSPYYRKNGTKVCYLVFDSLVDETAEDE